MITLFSALVLLSVLPDSCQSNLVFTLANEKREYLECESIFLTVALQNVGAHSLRVNRMQQGAGTLRFIVRDREGRVFGTRGGAPYLNSEQFNLAVDEVYELNLNLIPTYGTGSHLPVLQTERFLPAGGYTVQGVFFSGSDTLYSNEVSFQVIPPRGIEKDALDSFKDALSYANGTPAGHSEEIQRLRSMAMQYPQSVYTASAFMEIVQTFEYGLFDKRAAKSVALQLIDRYPNDTHAISALRYVLTQEANAETRAELLRSIASRYIDTRVGRKAKAIEQIISKSHENRQ